MHFPFNNKIANVFMVEIEIGFQNFSFKLSTWRRFVGESICFLKKGSIKFVKDAFNNFCKHAKFTFKEEKNGESPFLEALLVRKNHYIVTKVQNKKNNTNIYLNWNLFGPNNWE